MNAEEFFKNIGLVVFCIVATLSLIYYSGQCMSFQTTLIEGLENKPDDVAKPAGGVAGDTTASTDAIKATIVQIQDTMLVDKYKDDYIKKIIALDDLIDILMLKIALNIKPAEIQSPDAVRMIITQLGQMKAGRDALNDVMKTLDKAGGSTTF